MTKAIISVPADLSCNKLVSLREILANADPSLEYEFQSDATCSRTEVRQFLDQDCQSENPRTYRFAVMSVLQSALHKFDSALASMRRSGFKSRNSLN